LSSWLFRIAHNTGIDALRRARALGRHTTESATDGGPDDLPAPPSPDPVEQHALGRALDEALARLRPDQRTAVALRYGEGLAFEEIGRVLGIPEATARSHVHRARQELARLLSEAGWEPSR
jgi:RNA polymerase sigma factor (sigma-70 family)